MKNYVLFLLLALPLILNAQQPFFDFHPADSVVLKIYNDSVNRELAKFTRQFERDFGKKGFSGTDSVPIKLHFIRKADQNGQTLTEQDMENEIELVNAYFENANIHFFICPEINYIDNDSLFDFDHDVDEDTLLNNHYFPTAVNIYVANKVISNGRSVGGTGRGLGGEFAFVMMVYTGTGNGILLTHELGHVFHLGHTHGRYNFEDSDCPNEYWDDPVISDEVWCKGAAIYDNNHELDLNQDNIPDCQQVGDGICDTPAEPNLMVDSLTDGCTYIGTVTDPNGDLYSPTIGNIMSYGPCKDHLTSGQYAKMRFALENYGLHLLGHKCEPKDTFTVTTADNNGTGSLRWAMASANYQKTPTTINFNIPENESKTIYLESNLPLIRQKTSINGSSQPTGHIVLDGSSLPENYYALYVYSDSVQINNIALKNFQRNGIVNYRGYNNLVLENITIDSCGSEGLNIQSCENLSITNSQITNCGNIAVYMRYCENIDISGNRISGNGGSGLYIDSCQNILIGGSTPGQGNIIHSNTYNGISIFDLSNNIKIFNNYLGNSPNDTSDLGNGYNGLLVGNCFDIEIGDFQKPNFISGNHSSGAYLYKGSHNINISNNQFNSNGGSGISMDSCYSVSFGSIDPDFGNVAYANMYHGLSIGNECRDINIFHNYFGTDTSKSIDMGNQYYGLKISNSHNINIGKTSIPNWVIGNNSTGIVVEKESEQIFVRCNEVLYNKGHGIRIDSSSSVSVGGMEDFQQNEVYGSGYSGIAIVDESDDVTVFKNFVGTDAHQLSDFGNNHHGIVIRKSSNIVVGDGIAANIVKNSGYSGICIEKASSNITLNNNEIFNSGHYGICIDSSHSVFVGGEGLEDWNKIAGSGYSGICIKRQSNNISVLNNLVGTDKSKTLDWENGQNGLQINASHNITVGNASTPNVFANNLHNGIVINDGASNIDILNNDIFNNTRDGFYINNASSINIGGAGSNQPNQILGNEGNGVAITHNSSYVNIAGNNIISNGGQGIYIDSCQFVEIGGETGKSGNIISDCGRGGIYIENKSNNIQIFNNLIGVDTSGMDTLKNRYNGIAVKNSSTIQIGGVGKGNIVSGNNGDGVSIFSSSSGVLVLGNKIGVGANGKKDLRNRYAGIRAKNSKNVVIGGDGENAQNIIGFNESSIVLDSSENCLISQNSMFCSVWEVYLTRGANNNLPAPSVDSVPDQFTIKGKSLLNSEVYVYKSDTNCTSCEGKYFLGKTNASGGIWELRILDTLANREQITAMANFMSNSSAFSECFEIQGMPTIAPGDTSGTPGFAPESTAGLVLQVYPNPANSEFVVSLHSPKPIQGIILKLYNPIGSKVLEIKDKPVSAYYTRAINVGGLPKGIYLLVVETEKGWVKRKVLLQSLF